MVGKGAQKMKLTIIDRESDPVAEAIWQILRQLRKAREEAAEEKKSQDVARRIVAEIREDAFDKAISIVEAQLNQKPKGFGEKLMDRLTEVYEENK